MKIKEVLKKLLDITFWKFILVGVANTVFGTAVMFLVDFLLGRVPWVSDTVSYWVSSACNYIFGSILSFFLNKHFTFQNKEKGWKPVLRFTLNIVVCYLIAYGAAKPAMSYILRSFSPTIQKYGAMLTGTGLFIIINYLGQRFFAFRAKTAEDADAEREDTTE